VTLWYEYVGNIHIHTTASDGTGTFSDVARAAQAAGLDFIIVTDHNKLCLSEEGWRGPLLVLIGEEIHNPDRNLEGSHLLCLGVREDLSSLANDPQALIDAVGANGGVSFLAHPFDRASDFLSDTYPWLDWGVNGFTGIELWNYMAEFRSYAVNRWVGLLIVNWPQYFTRGPWPETLAKWDELTRDRPVVALGGSDVHATPHHFGPWTWKVHPYELCFRAVNTHILTPEPFSGDLDHDRALVLEALRRGHCWVGYDLPALTTGFRFWARQGERIALMGDRLPPGEHVHFEIWLPRPAHVRLIRDGKVIARTYGDRMHLVTSRPGVYRVEAYRRAWGRRRAWIFSNPIYVREG